MKPQPQKPKPKRKQLTLAERVKVIQRKKNGDSIKTLQEAFDVGRTQITVILRDKDLIMQRWESGEDGSRKVKIDKKSRYQDVNYKLLVFFQETRARNIPLNGPMLKARAMQYSLELGLDDFQASNGEYVNCDINNV